MNIKISNANQPSWKVVNVKSHIPEALKKLDELAHNLWWAWNTEAIQLFASLDNDLWKKVKCNPIDLLRSIDYDRLTELSKDEETIARMDKVYNDFRKYMDVKPNAKRASVAYFCMEYGLIHVLKIYSGGLGILAGDYLKEASDSNVDMVASTVMATLRRAFLWTASRLPTTKHKTSTVCLSSAFSTRKATKL